MGDGLIRIMFGGPRYFLFLRASEPSLISPRRTNDSGIKKGPTIKIDVVLEPICVFPGS